MQLTTPLLCLSLGIAGYAHPIGSHIPRELEDALQVFLFDAPAYPDPANQNNKLVSVQAYAYKMSRNMDDLKGGLSLFSLPLKWLTSGGIDTDKALDRIRLAAADGQGNQELTVNITGCSQQAVMAPTPADGLTTQNVSVGECTPSSTGTYLGQLSGVVNANMTVFSSQNSSFGVISDIDDTVKISNVLDKSDLIEATLFDDPRPVVGMPKLYESLSTRLQNPNFIYISGSPFQLVPFLQDFLASSYPKTRGPVFARELMLDNLSKVIDFVTKPEDTMDFKLSQIDRVHKMFPMKSFLLIGDSTEKDPEIYGEAFRRYGGNFVRCIWIRRVGDAEYDENRFNNAFKEVPSEKTLVYSDEDIIKSLPTIDVDKGVCEPPVQ